METIPIFFTFDRYYVLAACVAFHSLLTNAAPACFFTEASPADLLLWGSV